MTSSCLIQRLHDCTIVHAHVMSFVPVQTLKQNIARLNLDVTRLTEKLHESQQVLRHRETSMQVPAVHSHSHHQAPTFHVFSLFQEVMDDLQAKVMEQEASIEAMTQRASEQETTLRSTTQRLREEQTAMQVRKSVVQLEHRHETDLFTGCFQELCDRHASEVGVRDAEIERLRQTIQERDRDVTRANEVLQGTDVAIEVGQLA